MVLTRAKRRAAEVQDLALNLPDELWQDIFSRLRGKDVGRALCAAKLFAGLDACIWRGVCERHWPAASAVAFAQSASWKGLHDYFQWREREIVSVPRLSVNAEDAQVTPKHRRILNEWLLEVAMEWQLDTTVPFQTVAFMDHCLAVADSVHPKRLQLLGLGCLRAALLHYKTTFAGSEEEHAALDERLDLKLASEMTECAFSPEEMDAITQDVLASVPEGLASAPNVRLFLRYWWYFLTRAGDLRGDDLHVYTLAGFLSQMSLLDHRCCSFKPSQLGAAALALSLRFFGREDWASLVARVTAYTPDELDAPMEALRTVQASVEAKQFRRWWAENYAEHGFEAHAAEWSRALELFAAHAPMPV